MYQNDEVLARPSSQWLHTQDPATPTHTTERSTYGSTVTWQVEFADWPAVSVMVYINEVVLIGSLTVDPTAYLTLLMNTSTMHGVPAHVCDAGAEIVYGVPAELVALTVELAGAARVGGLRYNTS
jgi:hypothetical protein